MWPRSRGPGTFETATFISLLCAVRLALPAEQCGRQRWRQVLHHPPCNVGRADRWSSLASVVASDVSRTRSQRIVDVHRQRHHDAADLVSGDPVGGLVGG